MIKVIIRTDRIEDFFERARKAAQKSDHGEPFNQSVTFSFEDPHEALMVLSEARSLLLLEEDLTQPNDSGQ